MNKKGFNHFFILGAAKSGTTSLHYYLSQHPEICMSKPKEPFYFELTSEFEKGLDFYQDKYFNHYIAEKWLGDARHRNLYLPWVPERIKKRFKNPKFIIILREPAERAYSHYWHWRTRNKENLTFTEAVYSDYKRIKRGKKHKTKEEKELYQKKLGPNGKGIYKTYLDSGYYYEQIRRFQNLFPSEDFLILLSEKFFNRPEEVVKQVTRFLELEPPPSLDITVKNKGFRSKLLLIRRMRRYLGKIGFGNLVPKYVKEQIRDINRKPRPLLQDIDPLCLLWLYNHFKKKNRSLSNNVDLDLQVWKEKQRKVLSGDES